jgi:2'-phosphotransferase
VPARRERAGPWSPETSAHTASDSPARTARPAQHSLLLTTLRGEGRWTWTHARENTRDLVPARLHRKLPMWQKAAAAARGGGGAGWRRRDDPPDIQLSRRLSSLLRHRAQEAGVSVGADGFAAVADVLALPRLAGVTVDDVRRVVRNDAKQRFALDEAGGRIRARQGHTMTAVKSDALLRRVDAATAGRFAACVHGTRRSAWAAIAVDGLRRMARNQIHFAQGVPGEPGIVSGLRESAEVLIFVDLRGAVEDGVPFFVSDNGVLLSPGVEFRGNAGCVPPRYFTRVVDRATRQGPSCMSSGGSARTGRWARGAQCTTALNKPGPLADS